LKETNIKIIMIFTIIFGVLLGSCAAKDCLDLGYRCVPFSELEAFLGPQLRYFYRQDSDLLATCEENKDALVSLGYTGDCETLIQDLGEVNIKEIMKNVGGAKNKGGPKDMKKPMVRDGACPNENYGECYPWRDCYSTPHGCFTKRELCDSYGYLYPDLCCCSTPYGCFTKEELCNSGTYPHLC